MKCVFTLEEFEQAGMLPVRLDGVLVAGALRTAEGGFDLYGCSSELVTFWEEHPERRLPRTVSHKEITL